MYLLKKVDWPSSNPCCSKVNCITLFSFKNVLEIFSSERKALKSHSSGSGTRTCSGGGVRKALLSGSEARRCLGLRPLSLLFINFTLSETLLFRSWWGVVSKNLFIKKKKKKSSWKMVASSWCCFSLQCEAMKGPGGRLGKAFPPPLGFLSLTFS